MEAKIKASELRIGNFVTLNEKIRREMWNNQISAENEYFKVDTIYSDGDVVLELDSENVDFPSKDLEPIQISEYWLLKLGFTWKNTPERHMLGSWSSLSVCRNLTVELSGNYLDIKYIHQLQNLYFALTGSELTINEQK